MSSSGYGAGYHSYLGRLPDICTYQQDESPWPTMADNGQQATALQSLLLVSPTLPVDTHDPDKEKLWSIQRLVQVVKKTIN